MGFLAVMWICNTAQSALKWNKTYALNIFSIYVLKIIFPMSHVKVVNDLQIIRRLILSLYLIKKYKHLLEG